MHQVYESQKYRDRTKLWLLDYRQKHPCEICGESHVACLAFHHIDPTTKKYTISAMPHRGCGIELILTEIAKCRVLCHNCHAKLHFEQTPRPCVERSMDEGRNGSPQEAL